MYLFYNPTIQADAMHASLFWGDNIYKIRCAHMGHGILSVWRQMGILKKVVSGCVNDDITPLGLYQLLRARRVSPAWQKMMLEYLQKRRRYALVEQFCLALQHTNNDVLTKALEEARRALGKE